MVLILICFWISLMTLLSWHHLRLVTMRRARNIWRRLRKVPLRFSSVVDLEEVFDRSERRLEFLWQSKVWNEWSVWLMRVWGVRWFIYSDKSEMAMANDLAWRKGTVIYMTNKFYVASESKCLESTHHKKRKKKKE